MANETGLIDAVGSRNARYYISTFNVLENTDGAWRPSWNWAAFVCSTGWFFYRRMFVYGAVNLALLLLVLVPQSMHLTPEESAWAGKLLIAYVVIGFAVIPLLADWLYYRYLRRRVAAGSAAAPSLISFGMAAAAMTAAAAASIHALAIATSVDYEVRVHVVDALLGAAPYKAAVDAVAKEKSALPETTAELPRVAPLRLPEGIKLVEIVPGGIVRVAFTGYRHINGRWVEFVPTLAEKTVEWRCYNIDMPDKELPSLCRVKRSVERKPPAPKTAPGAASTPAAGGK